MKRPDLSRLITDAEQIVLQLDLDDLRDPADPAEGRAGEFALATIRLPVRTDDDPDREPLGIFFIDAATGRAFAGELVHEASQAALAGSWRALVAQLDALGEPAPRRIRVEDPALAETLRAAVGDAVELVVQPTPDVEALVEALDEYLDVPISYFHQQGLDIRLLREFFAAAVAYRRTKPWEFIRSGELLSIDAPALGLREFGLAVVFDSGIGGLQILRSPHVENVEGADAIVDRDDEERIEEAGRRLTHGARFVIFYPRRELPEELREELLHLPFAPKGGAIPALVGIDDHGRRRGLVAADYRIAIVALKAVRRFVDEHRETLANDDLPDDARYEIPMIDGPAIAVDLSLLADDEPVGGRGIPGDGPEPDATAVHRLKVRLLRTQPPIWRRVEVPSRLTLSELHDVLQAAMGWGDEHPHNFNHQGRVIGPALADAAYDEDRVELWAVLRGVGETMRYVYDFGDNWCHEVTVEALGHREDGPPRPRCIDGRRACPPENCGGILGLDRLLRRRGGPREDGAFADYDPKRFSAAEVDAKLAALFEGAP